MTQKLFVMKYSQIRTYLNFFSKKHTLFIAGIKLINIFAVYYYTSTQLYYYTFMAII